MIPFPRLHFFMTALFRGRMSSKEVDEQMPGTSLGCSGGRPSCTGTPVRAWTRWSSPRRRRRASSTRRRVSTTWSPENSEKGVFYHNREHPKVSAYNYSSSWAAVFCSDVVASHVFIVFANAQCFHRTAKRRHRRIAHCRGNNL